jgi:hypothetical protein
MTMRRPYEVTISLCIRHPMIEPSWITETLGIEPQHAWKAGDPRRDGAGRELGGVHRESYWLGRVPQETPISPERMPIETVVTRSLVQLRPCYCFLEKIHGDGGAADLLVRLSSHEDFRLNLSADSLALLGRLRLSVALDVHHSPYESTVAQVELTGASSACNAERIRCLDTEVL